MVKRPQLPMLRISHLSSAMSDWKLTLARSVAGKGTAINDDVGVDLIATIGAHQHCEA